MKRITYIFPIFNEEENIDLLWKEIQRTTDSIRSKYLVNFIFVDDGSSDGSYLKLREIQESDSRITVIELARNYGHQIAVTAGIDHSDADAVIIMDSDMQDPPAVSLQLIEKWNEGYEVVYAQRRSRRDTAFKRFTASAFYRVLHRLADIEIPKNTGDFRLIDRKVVNEIKRFKEHNRFLRGLFSYVGFRQVAVPFDRHERYAGTTGYPLKKMIRFALDGVFSFSTVPLRVISHFGYFIALLSVVGIIYSLTAFGLHQTVPGWTFIAISIFFVGGIQLIMLGVIGNYIGRIYTEVQDRPLYGIANILESNK